MADRHNTGAQGRLWVVMRGSRVIQARRHGDLLPAGSWRGVVSDWHPHVVNISVGTADVAVDSGLEWPEGELRFSLVGRSVAMNDLAVLLPDPLGKHDAPSGSRVAGGPGGLTVRSAAGVVTIELRDSRRWSGRFARAAGSPRSVTSPAAVAAELAAQVAAFGRRGGFIGLFRPAAGNPLTTAAVARLGDVHQLVTLPAVIGLGPGLTPSGDDFVTGALLAQETAVEYGWLPPALPVAALAAGLRRTNPAGRTLLVQALDGRFPAYLMGLRRAIHHLAAGREAEAGAAIRDVLRVGHSSGTDTVCGAAWLLDRCTQAMPDRTRLARAG